MVAEAVYIWNKKEKKKKLFCLEIEQFIPPPPLSLTGFAQERGVAPHVEHVLA